MDTLARRATVLLRKSAQIRYDFWHQLGIALCVEVLAWVAGAEERHTRAAELLGAAGVFWRAVGVSPMKYGHFLNVHERCEARARRALGDKAFQAAVLRGETAEPGSAVALALGEQPTRPDQASASTMLTPREHDIALLVAQGLSNREIAARLVIGQRTAEGHVGHILAKLGFHSRAQVAVWAADHVRDT